MANYVKFLRGTPAAYNSLETKQADTLYFISEKDSLDCKLYLGEKLIAGGSVSGDGSGVSTLAELQDVLLTSLQADSFLVYKDGKWVNKHLD